MEYQLKDIDKTHPIIARLIKYGVDNFQYAVWNRSGELAAIFVHKHEAVDYTNKMNEDN